VIMSVNQAELGDYPALAEELGAHYRFDPGGVVAREGYDRSPEAFNPDGDRAAELECQFGPPSSDHADPEDGSRQPQDDLLCGAARSLHIEPNGELRPCSILEVSLGNVIESSVSASFESPVARDMRALRWRHVHGCRACDLARWCARCHASALAETGDALGPYPSACAAARRALRVRMPESELQIIAANGKSVSLGPYRRIAPGTYETFDDIVTAEDRALRERLGWVLRAEGGNTPPEVAVRPGELVQIRRPGRRAPSVERVPGGAVR
jgi:radical SAM protein with 4Fe4S-binding SPASM domain